MTSSRSAVQITSSTTVVPTCDAWINMQYDTDKAPTVNDGYGILGTHRVSAGVYGISFSNPEQFGGGAYIAICTPEIGNDTEYGPQTLECLGNNPTATGKSAGIRLVNFRYKDGFHSGGGTASISDSATLSAVRSNVAVFSFATNNDLGSVSVFNGFQWSEQFNNSFWSQPTLPASLTAVNEFTPFGATTGVFQFTGADSPTVNYFSQTKGTVGVT